MSILGLGRVSGMTQKVYRTVWTVVTETLGAYDREEFAQTLANAHVPFCAIRMRQSAYVDKDDFKDYLPPHE